MRAATIITLAGIIAGIQLTPSLVGAAEDKLTPGRHAIVVHAASWDWTASVHVPKTYNPAKPTPVVLILHGAGGNGRHYLDQDGWARKAEEAGFIAVAPDGLPAQPRLTPNFVSNPRVWNSGQLLPRSPRSLIDDVTFCGALLDEIERLANVDKDRVYLSGHSNGAGMAFRLGAELSERFAAIAPVASQCWVPRPRPKRPLPTLFIIGTADPLVPFHGGESTLPWGGKRYTPPVEDSLKQWARAIGCAGEPVPVTTTNHVRVIEYRPQASGALLRACFIEDHGHAWPGSRQLQRTRLMGRNTSPLHATDVIWDFFCESWAKARPQSGR